jgi:LmbE family N-acetylglucosaminyl deacetylase
MNVLAVGAHPLDIVFLCGGTLARYARAHNSVGIAYLCLPVSEDPSVHLDVLAEQRERETNQAAALIGAEAYFLRIPPLELDLGPRHKRQVTDLVRRFRPDLIITHDPGDYHPDHETTSRLVHEATLLARIPDVRTDSPVTPIFTELVYVETVAGLGFRPERFVDITDVVETKRRMMLCYESEIAAWEDHPVVPWIEWMEVTSRFRGIQSGARYAEAFRPCHKWGHLSPERILP